MFCTKLYWSVRVFMEHRSKSASMGASTSNPWEDSGRFTIAKGLEEWIYLQYGFTETHCSFWSSWDIMGVQHRKNWVILDLVEDSNLTSRLYHTSNFGWFGWVIPNKDMLFSLKAINMINMPQDAPQTCDILQPTDGHVYSKSTMKWQNVELWCR